MRPRLISTTVLSSILMLSILAFAAEFSNVVNRYNQRSTGPIVTAGCGEDGSGELVEGYVVEHAQGQLVEDASGGLHFSLHINSRVEGIGLDTGMRYIDNSVTNVSGNNISLPYTSTYITNYFMNGQGQIGNIRMTIRYHFTINANGELTILFDETDSHYCGL